MQIRMVATKTEKGQETETVTSDVFLAAGVQSSEPDNVFVVGNYMIEAGMTLDEARQRYEQLSCIRFLLDATFKELDEKLSKLKGVYGL